MASRQRVGTVVSDKMDKTCCGKRSEKTAFSPSHLSKDPSSRTIRYKAQPTKTTVAKVGDRVRIHTGDPSASARPSVGLVAEVLNPTGPTEVTHDSQQETSSMSLE